MHVAGLTVRTELPISRPVVLRSPLTERGARGFGHPGQVRHSPEFERFGAFAEVFRQDPTARTGRAWYLELLNLQNNGAGAVQVVARCLSKAERAPDAIEALLLGPEGWRPQLVGCVSALLADPGVRPVDVLGQAASSYSWVSPQLLVTAALVGRDDWVARAEQGIAERHDLKAAAALAALADPVPPRIVALAELDTVGGDQLALRWKRAVGAAFDNAGFDRGW